MKNREIILNYLLSHPRQLLSIEDVKKVVNMKRHTIREYLRDLARMGIIETRANLQDTRRLYYFIP